MVPHSWISKTMCMFGKVKNMDKTLNESMKHWNTKLTGGKKT